METPLLMVAGIVTMGIFLVVLPVVLSAYSKFRNTKLVSCPETHDFTEVTLDSGRAALMSAFGKTALHVKSCALWPKRKGCGETCVGQNWPTA